MLLALVLHDASEYSHSKDSSLRLSRCAAGFEYSTVDCGCCFAGLAHDTLSAENAVIMLQSRRPPLILDPSGQASLWLQAHLKAQGINFEVVPMHSDRHALH